MREHTLLERLENREASAASLKPDSSALAASVLGNLLTVFNSRQGCCQTRADYGMLDMANAPLTSGERATAVAAQIRRQIEQFEPRLGAVVVRPVGQDDDPVTMHFHIQASLAVGDGERLRFDTIVGDDGSVRLQR